MGLGLGGIVSFGSPPGSGSSGGGSSSGINKFAADFTNVTSGNFSHGLNTLDVHVMVYDTSQFPEQIIPDRILITGVNSIAIVFNIPFSGRVVILG